MLQLNDIFVLGPAEQQLLLSSTHSHGLMLLSILIAVLASGFAFQVASLVKVAGTRTMRRVALLSGSLTLGAGIWAMHFIGMLAFQLEVSVRYDPWITAASMLPAILASWIVLRLLSQRQISTRQILIGGLMMGLGIGAMHYSGMYAMRSSASMKLDPGIFALSLLVAVGMSMLALWLRFGIKRWLDLNHLQTVMLGGIGMGLAIASMHYTGMAAARFIGQAEILAGQDMQDRVLMALSIALTMLTLGVVVGTTNGILRYRYLLGKMQASENRLRAMVDTAVDGIITINAQGIIESFNHSAERLFGWQADEVIGKNIRMLMPEPYSSQHDQYLKNYFRTGQARIIGSGREVVGLRRDGSQLPIRLAIGKTLIDHQPLFVGFVTDISEQRKMLLQWRLAKERAEQAAAAKSSFLANMSHEIRTPMNAIIGFTELLLDNPLNAEQRRHLQTVQRAARSLLRLLNDILDTAKLERGALELEPQHFNLHELCEELLTILSLQAAEKQLSLTLDYRARHEGLYADAFRLRQILTNLLGNAVKFTEQGSVSLQVSEDDNGLLLVVEDTGIGIAADRLPHIFDPFAQADASMTRRFGGTGLGTTIARQLSELMGGQLSVSSTLGSGSCFSLRLPLHSQAADAGVDRRASAALPALRILCADDVAENLELLQLNLTRAGHHVSLAADGQQAVEHCQQGDFDVILMDVQMPVLDGLDASRQIRAAEQRLGKAPTPIIALTASVLETDRAAALEAGMNGFAAKPLDWQALYREISRVLAGHGSIDDGNTVAADLGDDRRSAVQRWGSEVALEKALRRFQQGLAEQLQQLDHALLEHANEQAGAILHRLRGSALNLGLERLAQIVAQLEQQLKHAPENSLSVHALQQEARQLMAQLGSHSTEHSQQAAPLTAAPPAVDLQRLQQLLQDLRCGELDQALLDQALTMLPGSLAARLSSALDNFDFDLAVQLLGRWLTEHGERTA